MITKDNTFSITELRHQATTIIRKLLRKKGPFYVFRRSHPVAVMLDVDYFNQLEEAYEDYKLSLEAQEYEQENKNQVKWIPHQKVKKILNV